MSEHESTGDGDGGERSSRRISAAGGHAKPTVAPKLKPLEALSETKAVTAAGMGGAGGGYQPSQPSSSSGMSGQREVPRSQLMLAGLRSGKTLAALFGDVFGNIKGSFLATTEHLVAQAEKKGVQEDTAGFVRFDESMAEGVEGGVGGGVEGGVEGLGGIGGDGDEGLVYQDREGKGGKGVVGGKGGEGEGYRGGRGSGGETVSSSGKQSSATWQLNAAAAAAAAAVARMS